MKRIDIATTDGTRSDPTLRDKEKITIGTSSDAAIPQEILREAVLNLPEKRQCPCNHAVKDARFKEKG